MIIGRAKHLEPAAWALDVAASGDADQLGAGPRRIAHMLKDMRTDNEVERLVAKWERFNRAAHKRPPLPWHAGASTGPVVDEADVG